MIIGGEAFGFGLNIDTSNAEALNEADNQAQIEQAQIIANAILQNENSETDYTLYIIGGAILFLMIVIFIIFI